MSAVDHPEHYNKHPSGIECIDVVEHMSFNVGNAVKYLWRADYKGAPIEDLEKAVWYLKREIDKRTRPVAEEKTFVHGDLSLNIPRHDNGLVSATDYISNGRGSGEFAPELNSDAGLHSGLDSEGLPGSPLVQLACLDRSLGVRQYGYLHNGAVCNCIPGATLGTMLEFTHAEALKYIYFNDGSVWNCTQGFHNAPTVPA